MHMIHCMIPKYDTLAYSAFLQIAPDSAVSTGVGRSYLCALVHVYMAYTL